MTLCELALVEEVVALCPRLSVALRFNDLPVSKSWLHSQTAVAHLALLHLSSCPYPFYSQCTLPVLEELVLDGMVITESMRWPEAPSLRTIFIEDSLLHPSIVVVLPWRDPK